MTSIIYEKVISNRSICATDPSSWYYIAHCSDGSKWIEIDCVCIRNDDRVIFYRVDKPEDFDKIREKLSLDEDDDELELLKLTDIKIHLEKSNFFRPIKSL